MDNGNTKHTPYHAFEDWQTAQPTNFFTADLNLQRSLEFYWGNERYRQNLAGLYRFGSVAATALDQAARSANERPNLPRLQRTDAFGKRQETVVYHPDHHEAGRLVYGSQTISTLAEPSNNLKALALFYLSAKNGEAGHNCPVACTAGAVKALQNAASSQLQARYLPALLNPNYDANFTAAQFVTEIQGGSDVGANTVRATPLDPSDGSWLLNGRKWFCSHISADVALITARLPQGDEGTKGVALFLVPRKVENETNGIYIEKLKEKIGTASLATAEITLQNAVGWLIGTPESSFKTLMSDVINTSRVYNAFAVAGSARRAYVTAWTYTQHRAAFGHPILYYPLVQDILAKMRSDSTAILSSALFVANLLDQIERGEAEPDSDAVLRIAINLNKYRSAELSHEVIKNGIEVLGGNGAIESFSVLPRLLRDNIVYENWEGSPNVLMAQLQRDIRKHAWHKPFLAQIGRLFDRVVVKSLKEAGQAQLEQVSAELDAILALPSDNASIFFRPLMDRLADLFSLACMSSEGAWERAFRQDRSKQRLAEFFLNRRLIKKPMAEWTEYAEQVSRLCAEVRPNKLHVKGFDGDDDPFWE